MANSKKTLKVMVAGVENTRTTHHDYKFVVAAVKNGEWAKKFDFMPVVKAGGVYSWHKTREAAEKQLRTMTTLPKSGSRQVNYIITPDCLQVVEVPAQ